MKLLASILKPLRAKRARRLLATGAPRRIRIHSVTPDPEENPRLHRIAFEFLDPPGPWSMQFYQAEPFKSKLPDALAPGSTAWFYETDDGARTRVLKLEDGTPVWPS